MAAALAKAVQKGPFRCLPGPAAALHGACGASLWFEVGCPFTPISMSFFCWDPSPPFSGKREPVGEFYRGPFKLPFER